MLRAISSLPVPVSPRTSTSTSESATCSMSLEHFAHRRTAADDVVEAVGALDLPLEQFVLGADAALAQQPLGAGRQVVHRSRRGPGSRRPPAAGRPWPFPAWAADRSGSPAAGRRAIARCRAAPARRRSAARSRPAADRTIARSRRLAAAVGSRARRPAPTAAGRQRAGHKDRRPRARDRRSALGRCSFALGGFRRKTCAGRGPIAGSAPTRPFSCSAQTLSFACRQSGASISLTDKLACGSVRDCRV